MPSVIDLCTEFEDDHAPLSVRFSLPQAGWVNVEVPPLHEGWEIRCSEVFDPMPDLLEWLEKIAAGSPAATWSIDEEGFYSQLHFVGIPHSPSDPDTYLLHIQTNCNGLLRIRGVKVERRVLVASFYRGLRTMAEDPAYSPREWDIHPEFERFDDMDEEEYDEAYRAHPYSGTPIHTLRSKSIEDYIADVQHTIS